MDRNTMMIVITGMITGTILVSVLLQTIASVYSKRRRDGVADGLSEGATARIEDRLSRIEQAVEAMSVEVERISEGQRFTTRLLSERAAERV